MPFPDPVRRLLLSRELQGTLQLVVAVCSTSVVSLLGAGYIRYSCLLPVFTVMALAALSPANHVGSRLGASAALVGPAWVSLAAAGAVISLVHPLGLKGPAATATLSLLSLAGLALLTTIRASPQPTALLQGLLSVVLFGLGVLLGQLSPSTSLGDFWRHDVVGMGVGLLLAAAVTPVTSWAVAPSLAADEVASLTSEALQRCAALLSTHLSALIQEPAHHHPPAPPRQGTLQDGMLGGSPPPPGEVVPARGPPDRSHTPAGVTKRAQLPPVTARVTTDRHSRTYVDDAGGGSGQGGWGGVAAGDAGRVRSPTSRLAAAGPLVGHSPALTSHTPTPPSPVPQSPRAVAHSSSGIAAREVESIKSSSSSSWRQGAASPFSAASAAAAAPLLLHAPPLQPAAATGVPSKGHIPALSMGGSEGTESPHNSTSALLGPPAAAAAAVAHSHSWPSSPHQRHLTPGDTGDDWLQEPVPPLQDGAGRPSSSAFWAGVLASFPPAPTPPASPHPPQLYLPPPLPSAAAAAASKNAGDSSVSSSSSSSSSSSDDDEGSRSSSTAARVSRRVHPTDAAAAAAAAEGDSTTAGLVGVGGAAPKVQGGDSGRPGFPHSSSFFWSSALAAATEEALEEEQMAGQQQQQQQVQLPPTSVLHPQPQQQQQQQQQLEPQASLVYEPEPDEAAYLALLRHLSATRFERPTAASLRSNSVLTAGPSASDLGPRVGRSSGSRWGGWAGGWWGGGSGAGPDSSDGSVLEGTASFLGLRRRRSTLSRTLPTTTSAPAAAGGGVWAAAGGQIPPTYQQQQQQGQGPAAAAGPGSRFNQQHQPHPQQQQQPLRVTPPPASSYSTLLSAAVALLGPAAAEPPLLLTVPPPAAVRPWRYLLLPEGEEGVDPVATAPAAASGGTASAAGTGREQEPAAAAAAEGGAGNGDVGGHYHRSSDAASDTGAEAGSDNVGGMPESDAVARVLHQQQQEDWQQQQQQQQQGCCGGGGCYWTRTFQAEAWRRLIFAVQVVMLRVSALEALVEDTSVQAAIRGLVPAPAGQTLTDVDQQGPLYREAMSGVLSLLGGQLVGFMVDVARLVKAWDGRSTLHSSTSSSSSRGGGASSSTGDGAGADAGTALAQQQGEGSSDAAVFPSGAPTGDVLVTKEGRSSTSDTGAVVMPSIVIDAAGPSSHPGGTTQGAAPSDAFDQSHPSHLSGDTTSSSSSLVAAAVAAAATGGEGAGDASRGSSSGGGYGYAREPPHWSPVSPPGTPLTPVTPFGHQPPAHHPRLSLEQQRSLIAQQADASSSALLSQLKRQGSGGESSYLMEARLGWEAGRQLLGREAEAALGAYWWRVRGASKAAPLRVASARQAISVVFLWTLVVGFIEATEALEEAVAALLAAHTTPPTPPPTWRPTPATSQPPPAASGAVSSGAAGGKSASPGGAAVTDAAWGLTLPNNSTQHQECYQAAIHPLPHTHPSSSSSSSSGGWWREVGWAVRVWWWRLRCGAASGAAWGWPLVQLLLWVPGWRRLRELVKELPRQLSTRAGWRALASSRRVQAGFKYWVATGSVLLVTLVLSDTDSQVRAQAPVFGFVAVAVAMQERVETTADKVVLRVVGTIVGATLGHLLIIWPWPLAAIWHLALALAAAAALLGAFSETRARPGVGLALFTLAAVVLCQYEQACLRQAVAATAAAGGGPGSLTAPGTAESATEHALAGRCQPVNTVAYYLTRMISVVLGCVWAAIMNRLLLPWFTSDWAAEELAGALTAAAGLTGELYALNYSRMALINNQEQQGQQQGQGQNAQVQQNQQGQQQGQGQGGQQQQSHHQQPHQQQQQQRHAPRLAATAAELASWEADLLQQISAGVSGRVVAVTSSLARDVVSWRRGPWVTPRVVQEVARLSTELVEAVESLRLVLAPLPGGRQVLPVSGHCYRDWAAPMDPWYAKTLQAMEALAAATAAHLRRPDASSWQALGAALGELEGARLAVRGAFVALRRAMHARVHASAQQHHQQQQQREDAGSSATHQQQEPAAVASPPAGASPRPSAAGAAGSAAGLAATAAAAVAADPYWSMRPQDSAFFFAFAYGLSRVLNKVSAMARAALESSDLAGQDLRKA